VIGVQEMSVYGVSFDLVGKHPIVLLRTAAGGRYLPIWVGQPEAAAILVKLQDSEAPRPMTHDLFASTLGAVGARLVQVSIVALRDNTYYAALVVETDGERVEIDARPSDAIALAVRLEAPIMASDAVVEAGTIEMEDEPGARHDDASKLVEDFRRFLDDVRPDEFGSSDPA
jgi:bifunctional DNase/RNase